MLFSLSSTFACFDAKEPDTKIKKPCPDTKKTGILRIYYKDRLDSFDEYSFESRNLKSRKIEQLSKMEVQIITLVRRGMSTEEIADKLFTSTHNIENITSTIHEKVQLTTKEIIVSNNPIVNQKGVEKKNKQKIKEKRSYTKMTDDLLKRIDERLHNGEKVEDISEAEGVPKRTIYKAIEDGKIKRNPS
jgi:DNA-binding CsgD family transcriptional regulator